MTETTSTGPRPDAEDVKAVHQVFRDAFSAAPRPATAVLWDAARGVAQPIDFPRIRYRVRARLLVKSITVHTFGGPRQGGDRHVSTCYSRC